MHSPCLTFNRLLGYASGDKVSSRSCVACMIDVHRLIRGVLLLATALGVTSACASPAVAVPASAPHPVSSPPLSVTAPPAVGHPPNVNPPAAHPFVYMPGVYRYEIRTETTIGSPGDTRVDSVLSRALITLRIARSDTSAITIQGTVDTFTVSRSRSASAGPLVMSEIPFTLTALANGRLVEPVPVDTTAACTVPANLIGFVTRDWLAVMPVPLVPAVEWTDSSTVLACPSSLPVTARIARRSVAAWVAIPATWSRQTGDIGYQVSAATTTMFSGQGHMAGRSVVLRGDGQGSQLLYVDPELGVMLGGAGNSSTRVVIEAGSQRQEFVQTVSRQITLLR